MQFVMVNNVVHVFTLITSSTSMVSSQEIIITLLIYDCSCPVHRIPLHHFMYLLNPESTQRGRDERMQYKMLLVTFRVGQILQYVALGINSS